MKPKINFIPCAADDIASSRIRVFTLARALERMDVEVSFSDSQSCDVLFIQKSWNPHTLKQARLALARGTFVIFDLDDVYSPPHLAPSLLKLLRTANLITTDTPSRAEWIKNHYGIPRVEVIPDCIDYYPTGPERPMLSTNQVLRILWFGSLGNIDLFGKYVTCLSSIPGTELVAITHKADVKQYQLNPLYKGVQFLPWSRNAFIQQLQSCDVACLPHDGSEIDHMKSNNKMISSINWGVPALVSDTPEYARTANEIGAAWTVFRSDDELRQVVSRMRDATTRDQYLKLVQPEIWRRYSPQAVAQHVLNLVRVSLSEGLSGGTKPGVGPITTPGASLKESIQRFRDTIEWWFWLVDQSARVKAAYLKRSMARLQGHSR